MVYHPTAASSASIIWSTVETSLLEALIDHPARPGTAHDRPLTELAHAEAAAGGGVELEQHVVPGELQPTGSL